MKKTLPEKLEDGRQTTGPLASHRSWGAYGRFFVQGPCGARLCIVASGGDPTDTESQGWEHVSISTDRRPPNWQEMCFVKDLFWEPEECVIQYHPPRSEYVNNHPHCLHLWKPPFDVPVPPSFMVGIKSLGLMTADEAQIVRAALASGK